MEAFHHGRKTGFDPGAWRQHISQFFYLKEEFVRFLRENHLPAIGPFSESTPIEPDIVCSEKHRGFFAGGLGKSPEEAILCRKYKKALPGRNRCEPDELPALTLPCDA